MCPIPKPEKCKAIIVALCGSESIWKSCVFLLPTTRAVHATIQNAFWDMSYMLTGMRSPCTGLGKRVVPRLGELAPRVQKIRRRDSRNLGTTLLPSPVILTDWQYHGIHRVLIRLRDGGKPKNGLAHKQVNEVKYWEVHKKCVERRPHLRPRE